jgi:hypothetical protein
MIYELNLFLKDVIKFYEKCTIFKEIDSKLAAQKAY